MIIVLLFRQNGENHHTEGGIHSNLGGVAAELVYEDIPFAALTPAGKHFHACLCRGHDDV